MTEERVILTVTASPFRRWSGVTALVLLGALLMWIAFAGTAPILVVLALLLGAGGALWGAFKLHEATSVGLELTKSGLRTTDGQVLAAVGDIERVDKGAFAFKPSNGFLVRLKTPVRRGWAPGLWWRGGTFLGIGGVLPPGQTRAMAELLLAADKGELPEDML